jgi:hypothetical protein
MYLFEMTLTIVTLIAIWLILSSPFILMIFFIVKYMKKHGKISISYCIILSFLTAILIAPIPSPIITILSPLGGLSLITRPYPANDFYAHIYNFTKVSFVITWIISFIVIYRYVKPKISII